MFISIRQLEASSGRLPELLAFSARAREIIGERHGADMRLSIQIGGNANLVSLSGLFETLDDYSSFRESYLADPEMTEVAAQAVGIVTSVTDQLVRVLRAPGARQPFTVVNQAELRLGRVSEAIPFCLEICEFIEDKLDVKVGLANNFTGPRSGIGWIAHHPNLDSIAAGSQTLESDPEYLEYFKRSAELMRESSLTQSIWQAIE